MMDNTVDKFKCSVLMPNNDCDLYKQALEKLDYGFIRQPLRNQLIEANGKLNESIQNYFKHYIIINIVIRFLNSEKNDEVASSKTQKGKNVSSHPLYLNLVKKYIISESSKNVNLFGIKEEYINKTLEITKKSQLKKEVLNKHVEKSIFDMCQSLIEYYGYGFSKNWKKTFRQCVTDLSREVDEIASIEKEISSNEIKIDDLLLTYYEELRKGLSMLKRLLSLFEKKIDFEASLAAMYTQKLSTLYWKIKSFELEILKATYTRKANLALKAIRKQLDSQEIKLEESLRVTNADIQVYSILGENFEAIVKEYADISKKIEEQQWAVNSLKEKYSYVDEK